MKLPPPSFDLGSLEELSTEQANPATREIDRKSTSEILEIINREDATIPAVVAAAIPQITALVDDVVAAFEAGGRLVYIGAGTSGRLGVLDASECPPTYGTPPEMVQGLIAGGREALVRSVESAEDRAENGIADLKAVKFTAKDVLVGITASGQAPYVLGAMDWAQKQGAVVGAISCNARSRTFDFAKHAVCLPVGPEVVSGSTRMKSGTAQKLVLNMISTTAMIRIGKVYGNLMIDLVPVNRKLIQRSINLISRATGCPAAQAETAFYEAQKKPKIAILMVILGIGAADAAALADANKGHISRAIEAYRKDPRR